MTEKKEYHKFANDLWDGFDVLTKHTAKEIQFCKDMLKFFKKRIEIEEEYAKSLSKLSQKAQYAIPHGSVHSAWEAILTSTANTANIHNNVVTQLNEKVADALNVMIKDLESQRKTLVNDGNALNTEYANTIDGLKKTKLAYEKSCKEAEIAQLTHEKAKTDSQTKPKDLPKMEKEAAKKKTHAEQCDEEYKRKVEDTNNFMEKYFTERMPKILSEFEHNEVTRSHLIKTQLKKFSRIVSDAPPLLVKENESMLESIDKIHGEVDVDLFVTQNKTDKEIPDLFEYEPYQQGNQAPRAKPTDKLKKFIKIKSGYFPKIDPQPGATSPTSGAAPVPASPPPRPKTAIFGIKLEEVMEKQKDKVVDADLPYVLEVLVDAFFKLDGAKTEGIFRVPGGGSEVASIKDKLDNAMYDVVPYITQVHTPCTVLKMWLRELPDPLIPTTYYELCTETPEKGLEILGELTPITRKVITYLVNFLQELDQPEIVEATKMSTDNLAMVFAPSFLRCPYDDYNRILASADKQKAFMLQLLNNIPRATTPISSRPLRPVINQVPSSPRGGWVTAIPDVTDELDLPPPPPPSKQEADLTPVEL